MPITELVPWFQMASTIITGIGVIVSTSLGIATLEKNSQRTSCTNSPDLMFNIGGQAISASLSPLRSFPGKDPEDPEIQGFIKTLPTDTKCIELQARLRQLFNHGEGTAYDVSIWFEPDRMIVNGEVHRITRIEQTQPPNTKEWNSINAISPNLSSGEEGIFGIPLQLPYTSLLPA